MGQRGKLQLSIKVFPLLASVLLLEHVFDEARELDVASYSHLFFNLTERLVGKSISLALTHLTADKGLKTELDFFQNAKVEFVVSCWRRGSRWGRVF